MFGWYIEFWRNNRRDRHYKLYKKCIKGNESDIIWYSNELNILHKKMKKRLKNLPFGQPSISQKDLFAWFFVYLGRIMSCNSFKITTEENNKQHFNNVWIKLCFNYLPSLKFSTLLFKHLIKTV